MQACRNDTVIDDRTPYHRCRTREGKRCGQQEFGVPFRRLADEVDAEPVGRGRYRRDGESERAGPAEVAPFAADRVLRRDWVAWA